MLEIVEGYNFIIKVGLNPQEEDSFGVINPFIVIKVVIVGVVATMGVVNVAVIVIVAKVVNVVNSHQAFLPLPSIL